MSEKEECDCCAVVLENLTLEKRVSELEAKIEAIELFVESLKQIIFEKVGLAS